MSAAPSRNTKQAEQHLRHTDAIMAELIERHGPCRLHERCGPPFEQLVVAIINQLISRQAARAIEARVRKLAPDFTPAAFTRITADHLRAAGLSRSKAGYILDTARMARSDELDLQALARLSDTDIIKKLTAIRGIGPWTAQMVLLFGYRRPNVLAPGDAGLRRAAQMLYGENTQLMDMHPVWSPWCSVASWYLWHTLHQRDRQPPADDPGPAP